eukprot:347661-Chlamydomonas_euryale.AAC.1
MPGSPIAESSSAGGLAGGGTSRSSIAAAPADIPNKVATPCAGSEVAATAASAAAAVLLAGSPAPVAKLSSASCADTGAGEGTVAGEPDAGPAFAGAFFGAGGNSASSTI